MPGLNGKKPRKVKAMVYIMNEGPELQAPSEAYYDIIAEGYERFGFDRGILEAALE